MLDQAILVFGRTPARHARHKPLPRRVHAVMLSALRRELAATRGASLLLALEGSEPETAAIARRLRADSPARAVARVQQGSGSFGLRLIRALDAAAARGVRRVLVVADDTPELEAERLDQALAHLARPAIVVGPCLDGGAWVLGLTLDGPHWPALRAALQSAVPWKTDGVSAALRQIAGQLDLPHIQLETLADLDAPADWRVLRERLRSCGRGALAAILGRALDPVPTGASAIDTPAPAPRTARIAPRGPPIAVA